MADRRKRSLERAAAQTGDEDSAARAILAGMRTGEVYGPLVELHAELGEPVARRVCGRPDRPDRPPDEDRVRELCSDPAYGLAHDDPLCGRMVYVPGGVSIMGSAEDENAWPDERPQMLVCVPPFWIAQRPLTLVQWQRGGGTGGNSVNVGDAVVNVSWDDAQEWLGRQGAGDDDASGRVIRGGDWDFPARYCRAADRYRFPPGIRRKRLGFRLARSVEGDGTSRRVSAGGCRAAFRDRYSPGSRWDNLGFRPARDARGPLRLPTEDEWERAARGWDGRRYPWGDEWVDDREERRRHPSPWDVHDMSGEVWQWCGDAWSESRHGEVANG